MFTDKRWKTEINIESIALCGRSFRGSCAASLPLALSSEAGCAPATFPVWHTAASRDSTNACTRNSCSQITGYSPGIVTAPRLTRCLVLLLQTHPNLQQRNKIHCYLTVLFHKSVYIFIFSLPVSDWGIFLKKPNPTCHATFSYLTVSRRLISKMFFLMFWKFGQAIFSIFFIFLGNKASYRKK